MVLGNGAPAMDVDMTPSGNVKLSKQEYEELTKKAGQTEQLKQEITGLRALLASAAGNVSAVLRKMDKNMQEWLSEEDKENIPTQKFE